MKAEIRSGRLGLILIVCLLVFYRTSSENETFTRVRRDPNGLKLPMSPSGEYPYDIVISTSTYITCKSLARAVRKYDMEGNETGVCAVCWACYISM